MFMHILIFDTARFASSTFVKYYYYSDPSFEGGQKIALRSKARVSSVAPVLLIGWNKSFKYWSVQLSSLLPQRLVSLSPVFCFTFVCINFNTSASITMK